MRKGMRLLVVFVLLSAAANAQGAEKVFYALREKLLKVKDYTADVKIKIDVAYMKIPEVKGKLYFKAPDKMRLERNGGLSVLPRKNVSMTLNNLVPAGEVTALDAGYETIGTKKTRVVKVIPNDESSNIVLAKIWIDEKDLVALRTETTTKDQGMVVMKLEYGKYIAQGLPDKVAVQMDVKEYKLPQGVTMDYNDAAETQKPKQGKAGKGTIQLTYLKYDINTGLSDAVFKVKQKK
jgi:outer membrane lipoprotein-sorting protein